MRCLFCLDHTPPSGFSAEHVFPDAVGGTLVIHNVCKHCNDKLGASVDVTITDHTLVQFKRMQYGIAGKSGKVPNPLACGTLASDPTQKLRLNLSPRNTTEPPVQVVPFLERTMIAPGKGELSVRVDAQDVHLLGPMINTALKRAKAPPFTDEQIAQLQSQITTTEAPQVNIPLSFDISQNQRGLLKIVYELACSWLGDSYIDDPMAVMFREFIFDEELPFDVSTKYALRGAMRLAPRSPFLNFWPAENDHLIAYLLPYPDSLGIVVSVLGVLDASITVTTSPAAYGGRISRFLCINPVTGALRESTFEQEVGRIKKAAGPTRFWKSPSKKKRWKS